MHTDSSLTTTYADNFNYVGLRELEGHVSIQIGDLKLSVNNSDINGWLICDGRSLARNEYKRLYNAIGNSFGSEDESSFNLPDFRGRVCGAIGLGPALSTRNLGDYVGEETHVLTIPEMPIHHHTGTTDNSLTNVSTNPAGSHSHTYTYTSASTNNGSGVFATGSGTSYTYGVNNNTNTNSTSVQANHTHGITDPQHNHTFTTQDTGGSLAHNNMQPTLFGCNYMIFAKYVPLHELVTIAYADMY